MITPSINIPSDFALTTRANTTWTLKPNLKNLSALEVYLNSVTFISLNILSLTQHPLPPTSPLISQQSSPANSRAGSPNRGNTSVQQAQYQHYQAKIQKRNLHLKSASSFMSLRRPSFDTTQPPIYQLNQQIQSNELVPQFNSKSVDDVSIAK